MKKIWIALFLLLTLLNTPSTLRAATPLGWEKIGNDDGVEVFKKDVPGSPFVAFRGEGVIDAPLWKVFSVMADDKRSIEWVDDLVEFHVIRNVSQFERIEYNHVGTPFVVKDRDFVMDIKVVPDHLKRTILVLMHSVGDPAAPETKYVRGVIMESSFILRSIDAGGKVLMTAEVHVDPKGSIPSWLVNLLQKDWPHNTLYKLRKQCAKNDIKRFKDFDTIFWAD